MLQHTENEAKNAISDRALVDRLGEGNGRALDVLFRRHATTVFAYAVSRLRNRTDAEEVVQDTFVILWERRRDVLISDSFGPVAACNRTIPISERSARSAQKAL